MTGEAPHITAWMNDEQIIDSTDSRNHAGGPGSAINTGFRVVKDVR